MQLLIVFLVFLATSLASIFVLSKRSDRFWELTEYILLSVALVGIAAAVADISASRKQQAVSDAAAASLSAKSRLNYRTEWIMNSCGIWWNDVLNQTNDTPPACFQTYPTIVGTTCESSCRAAHFVGQHRMQTYSPTEEHEAASGLHMNICYDGAEDIGMCSNLESYLELTSKHAELSASRTLYEFVSGGQASFWIQVLFALTLGVQAGKIRRDASSINT
ncbi:hypothetical protein ACSQ76_22710 [Roseovarius sp. B08]|uniref:hypothetical protein n=1 Tax=Roseovarius sp. B08 TaxID=3449223 RepID=UPI003EDC701C